MFERFTERARQVVVLAQSEAQDLGHDYIGTEHILLGLLREEEGVAAQGLESLGVTLEGARARVEAVVGLGDGQPAGQIPFTPRAKTALERSLREALSLGHNHIGTEHILLGLVRDKDGRACALLLDMGVDANAVRDRVTRRLAMPGAGTAVVHRPARWEYRVERLEDADALSAERLDAFGEDGWELATVTAAAAGVVLVFKRRRR